MTDNMEGQNRENNPPDYGNRGRSEIFREVESEYTFQLDSSPDYALPGWLRRQLKPHLASTRSSSKDAARRPANLSKRKYAQAFDDADALIPFLPESAVNKAKSFRTHEAENALYGARQTNIDNPLSNDVNHPSSERFMKEELRYYRLVTETLHNQRQELIETNEKLLDKVAQLEGGIFVLEYGNGQKDEVIAELKGKLAIAKGQTSTQGQHIDMEDEAKVHQYFDSDLTGYERDDEMDPDYENDLFEHVIFRSKRGTRSPSPEGNAFYEPRVYKPRRAMISKQESFEVDIKQESEEDDEGIAQDSELEYKIERTPGRQLMRGQMESEDADEERGEESEAESVGEYHDMKYW